MSGSPIPLHLVDLDWYAPYLAWLDSKGITPHHDPGDAEPQRMDMTLWSLVGDRLHDADLRRMILTRASVLEAYLAGADLSGAELVGAELTNSDLTDANLTRAHLGDADLSGVCLTRANLTDAYLARANLTGAELWGANLEDAYLAGATLTGATLPDGRTYEQWQADPLAGLFDDEPDTDPEDRRLMVATFIALFEGGHLPRPGGDNE